MYLNIEKERYTEFSKIIPIETLSTYDSVRYLRLANPIGRSKKQHVLPKTLSEISKLIEIEI